MSDPRRLPLPLIAALALDYGQLPSDHRMTSFVTQCPHCHTSFRVSRSQLAAAHGVVRCGACMELFNAARYLQEQDSQGSTNTSPNTNATVLSPVSEPAHPLAPPPAKSTITNETLWIHDDLDLDSLDLDEELAKLEQQELELSRELLELEPRLGETRSPAPVDRAIDQDELWAEQLLKAELSSPQSSEQQQDGSAEDEYSFDKTAIQFRPVTSEHPAPPSPLAPHGGTLTEQRLSAQRQDPVLDDSTGSDEALPHSTLDDQSQADAESRAATTTRTLRDDPLFDLNDEPLQLDWEARRRPWGRWLGWGLLNLIALLALAAQYVAYNYDELARQDEYRPWLEQICPAVGCELPPRVDISQIRSSNLVVRSHPDFSGALVVDAIIYNRAHFAQPFPLLEIRFDDIQGKALAQRTFKPGEYLSGELAGQREMPSQIPIHIALDILDPGTTAVNYSLSFRSPD